jgi:hypothetical protein
MWKSETMETVQISDKCPRDFIKCRDCSELVQKEESRLS